MFYRFLSKLATQERLEAFPVPLAGSDWKKPTAWMPSTKDYEEKFEPIGSNIPTLGVKYFQAPLFTDSGEKGLRLRFHQGKEAEQIPDIWGVEGRLIVSEKFKQVLESIDDMKHEFIPIEVIDWEQKNIKTEQNYYWFNQRRFLRIEPSKRIARHNELGFLPLTGEEDFLARVIDTPSLRDEIEKVSIWQHYGMEGMQGRASQARCLLYLNKALFEVLSNEKLVGIDEYSQPYGLGEESICAL